MSLYHMTVRRVKKVLAWIFALVILALLGFGFYYVAVVGV